MVESVRVGVFFDILEGVGLILSKSAIEKDENRSYEIFKRCPRRKWERSLKGVRK